MLSHFVFTVEGPNSSTVLEIPNVLIFMKIQNILSKKIKYTQRFLKHIEKTLNVHLPLKECLCTSS